MQYPVFQLPVPIQPSLAALAIYLAIGAVVGMAAVGVTRAVYWVEDAFEHIPIHWMWWPAIGAVFVGVIGRFQPRTLGVGYENISSILTTRWTLWTAASLCLWKFISWCIALGSGTSGGTLAPLFTIGSGLGLVLGAAGRRLFPGAGVELSIAALVGMAAIFAGASRALLASVVFAFETTLQPLGLLPLLGGCTAAYLVSSLLMRNTIMTEKISRRGVQVPSEYVADLFSQIRVREVASKNPTTLSGDQSVESVRRRLNSGEPALSHQGFPVVDGDGVLVGVLTRRNFADPALDGSRQVRELVARPPIIVYDDLTLRAAADHMVNHNVGRVVVVHRENPGKIFGILTRSDLLRAQRRQLDEMKRDKSILTRTKQGNSMDAE